MSDKSLIMPDDYKDPVYRITYAILGKIAPFVPASISPNQISVAGFVATLFANGLLFFVATPAAFLYWILFNTAWFILDALDGIHARLTRQTSEFGGFLDHYLDNISFIAMFTVFAIKFDLAHPLYIFILLMRITAAVMVFTVQYHTKRLYLDRVSGGCEFMLFTSVMFLSYLFPEFNPANHTDGPTLLSLIDTLKLQQGAFMKLTLFVYLIGVPINFILQLNFVRRECEKQSKTAPAHS